ncbi:MAG: lactate racemase domain-containing protein [Gemmataceae bacterium]
MKYPQMVRVKQNFQRPVLDDVPAAVRAQLDAIGLDQTIKPGQTVALTGGSRGIANIPLILRTVADYLKDLGAEPFLFPAMGSHGGGTPEGQREVLEGYGMTEEFLGIPLKSSLDVVQVGTTNDGFPVYLDKLASEADHIGVINRVKPHTNFNGPLESGLCKMMMIGLGKWRGAQQYHRLLLSHPFYETAKNVVSYLLSNASITFGVGIVENPYDETAYIEAVKPDNLIEREEAMLVKAKDWMPRLPLKNADILIIDEMGKNISGSGIDTNIVGRKRAFKTAPPAAGQPEMRFIFVRSLTEASHGNGAGIGLADFASKRLIDSLDYRATVINCVTSGNPEGANLPVHYETDKEVLDASLPIIGGRLPEQARILHIRNTLHVGELEMSTPCLDEPKYETEFEIQGEPYDIALNEEGILTPI